MSAILSEALPSPVCTASWPDSPYKGLNFYTAKDAALFCERDFEVDACGQLAAHFATKMVLLHGRTGTGKSSFLRAGLFPKFFLGKSNFRCLTDRQTGEPYLIRSTADPILSITDALQTRLIDIDEFHEIPSEIRKKALLELDCSPAQPPEERAARLRIALELITSTLSGTFILAIDQGEEIFTLGDNEECRCAYFNLLERFCYERFDIKVVLALRTEYYGQFADNFRWSPDLSVSTVHSGLEQFMLHGIQDAARLGSAILRPTLKESVAGLTAPYLKYAFDFEPGLADSIAQDVVHHCGESSTLPVMQMVCLDLYTSLVSSKAGTTINRTDYGARGGVEGTIDRFIETSLSKAIKGSQWLPTPSAIEAWRDVLSSLVARQEGGALTSLLMSESDLCLRARSFGIKQSPEVCLKALAQENIRLLRSVSLRSGNRAKHSTHYSLGHDALAPSLFQWKEARGKVLEARKRVRNVKITSSVTSVVVIIMAVVIFCMAGSYKTTAVNALLRSMEAEPQVRVRLLLLAALEKNTTWVERLFLPMPEMDAKLRESLVRSPVFAGDGSAAGLSKDGKKLALISHEGKVNVITLSNRSAESSNSSALQIDPPSIVSPLVFATGFLTGLDSPVVYKENQLFYYTGDTLKVESVGNINPDLKLMQPAFPEFADGVFRLTAWGQPGTQTTTITFYDFGYDSGTARLTPVTSTKGSLELKSRFVPVYAETSQLAAFTERDEAGGGAVTMFVISRANPSEKKEIAVLRPSSRSETASRNSGPNADRSLIPSSIAFLPDGDTVVFRNTIARFTFVKGIASSTGRTTEEIYSIPESDDLTALDPLRPQWAFGRPVLAAVQTVNDYRVAWLTEKGLSIFQSGPDRALRAMPERSLLLTSMRPLDSFTRVRFSGDGDSIYLIQQLGKEVSIRAWDLSEARLLSIARKSRAELILEACRVSAMFSTHKDTLGNQLSAHEFDALPVSLKFQPCNKD